MEDFQDTTATKKIFSLKKRIRAVSGGTAASKTISILVWLIDYACVTKNKVCTVISESYPHLEGGAIRDFKNIMRIHGYWEDKRWNESKHIYQFPEGTVIQFQSIDKIGKAHGPRRDVLFLNEANNMGYEIADQLITRTRETVWMDWNPTNEFWFYTEMLPKRDDIDFITVNYLDNEALDNNTKGEIESHKDNTNWWRVYGLGLMGSITERIYTDWAVIEEIDHHARIERYGLDWGYSNDPTCIVAIYYYNQGYIIDELLFQKGMLNKPIADVILNQPVPNLLTVADSAEPKSIDELKSYGVNIIGSEKGKDSVNNGIALVQAQRISVTKRSVNVIKEYRNYLWKKDKDGHIINEPEHEFSHSMDAIRYALTSLVKKPDYKPITPPPPIKPYYGDREIPF